MQHILENMENMENRKKISYIYFYIYNFNKSTIQTLYDF